MTRFLVVAGVIGAAVLAALFIAPVVIDWNGYRGTFAAELSRATGREVALDGPIEATFLPSPRILANNVRLSGLKTGGNDEGDLLRLRAVELQVGLLPLLTGHIVIERLTMVRPEILVETDATGKVSWVMDGAGGETLPDVALQRFAITDGTLVWRDRDHGVQARVEKISMKLTADSLSGPAKLEGGAQIGDVPVRFTANIGRIRESAATPFNLTFQSPDLHAKGEFVGQFTTAGPRLTGRLKMSGSDARAVLAALSNPSAGQGIAAALIAHPFAFEGRVSASPQLVEANDVIVDLGDQRATGALRVGIDPSHRGTAVDMSLAMPRLDLDGLATVPPLAVKDDADAVFPHDLDVKLAFSADAVVAAGKVLQGVVLKAALGDGALSINQFAAQLPGAGSLQIAGAFAGRDKPAFDGTIDAKAANLRDLLSWLQLDTASVPSGRLAGASLKAKLFADAERAEMSDIDLSVDTTRAHGSLRFDYRQPVGFHVDLAADRLDLDSYQEGDVPPATTAAVSISPTQAPDVFSSLSGDGRFAIGRLTYRGIDLRAVDLKATVANGEFTVADYSAQPSDPGEFQSTATADPALPPAAIVLTPRGEPPQPAVPTLLRAPAAEPPLTPKDDRDGFVSGVLKLIGN